MRHLRGAALSRTGHCPPTTRVAADRTRLRGHLTLEFSNASAADCRIYADEGIVQMLFFRAEACAVSYRTRAGKYQNQSQRITLPKV